MKELNLNVPCSLSSTAHEDMEAIQMTAGEVWMSALLQAGHSHRDLEIIAAVTTNVRPLTA